MISLSEKSFMLLLAQGYNLRAVADQICVYQRTLSLVIESICIKLALDPDARVNVRRIVRTAREQGVIQ